MAKKINRVRVIQRLTDRYQLTQLGTDTIFTLNESVQPVTLVDELLATPRGQKTSGSASSRTDTYTVPQGKVWIMKNMYMERSNGQSMRTDVVIDGVSYGVDEDPSATATRYSYPFPANFKVKAGDSVNAVFGSGTSGNMISHILYEELDSQV